MLPTAYISVGPQVLFMSHMALKYLRNTIRSAVFVAIMKKVLLSENAYSILQPKTQKLY
jgi:hypothetical protein